MYCLYTKSKNLVQNEDSPVGRKHYSHRGESRELYQWEQPLCLQQQIQSQIQNPFLHAESAIQ